MKHLTILLLLTLLAPASALELAIDENGVGNWVYATPDEVWFVTIDGTQGKVFDSNYELLDTFSTGAYTPYYIYGCGRDFDSDDNIEVMYSVYSTTNYTMTLVVQDIATGAIDLELPGSTDYSWSGSTFYANGERFVLANRQVLGTINYDRTVTYRSGVQHSVGENPTPHPSALQAWPNPFVPARQAGVNLSFSLQQPGEAKVTVYNARGQQVREIEAGASLRAGEHAFWWDGRNDAGLTVGSGVYLLCVRCGETTRVRKSIVLR